MRIIFFGDSLTRGTVGVGYVEKVAAALPQHPFINRGINGDTSLNLYRRVDEDVIAGQPDGVFILIGVNDALSTVSAAARSYFRLFKSVPGGRLSPIAFRENMRAILGKLKQARVQTWVGLPPVEHDPAAVAALSEINAYSAEVCSEMGVATLDIMAALKPQQIPERGEIGADYHRRNLAILLGYRKYEQWRAAGNYSYSFDGIHLTEDGAQRMADLIVPFLRANGVR